MTTEFSRRVGAVDIMRVRTALKMRQVDLAKDFDVAPRTIIRWEQGGARFQNYHGWSSEHGRYLTDKDGPTPLERWIALEKRAQGEQLELHVTSDTPVDQVAISVNGRPIKVTRDKPRRRKVSRRNTPAKARRATRRGRARAARPGRKVTRRSSSSSRKVSRRKGRARK